MTLAEIVLKDLIPEGGEPEITAGADHRPDRRLLRVHHRGPHAAQSAAAHLVTARQIAMYLCRELTDAVAAQDRPAVRRPRPHHGHVRRPEDPPADSPSAAAVFNQVTELTNRIKQQAR